MVVWLGDGYVPSTSGGLLSILSSSSSTSSTSTSTSMSSRSSFSSSNSSSSSSRGNCIVVAFFIINIKVSDINSIIVLLMFVIILS